MIQQSFIENRLFFFSHLPIDLACSIRARSIYVLTRAMLNQSTCKSCWVVEFRTCLTVVLSNPYGWLWFYCLQLLFSNRVLMFPALDARQLISIKNQRKKNNTHLIRLNRQPINWFQYFMRKTSNSNLHFYIIFFRLKLMRSSLIGLQLHHLMCGCRKIKVIICVNRRSL